MGREHRQWSLNDRYVALCDRWLPIDFRYAPFATAVMRRCKMTRWAKRRHQHVAMVGRRHSGADATIPGSSR